MHGFSSLRGFYVAILYFLVSDVIRRNKHFGVPIQQKVSGLEGCHVAILYYLRLGKLDQALEVHFKSGGVLEVVGYRL